jgi:CubicO group peptidase (beta-lactamase class C family)
MRAKYAFLMCSVICGLASAIRADDTGAPRERIHNFVDSELKKRSVPGAVITVVEHGTTVYQEAFGTANLESDSPMVTHSVFEIASVTKPFAAMAVMMLRLSVCAF